MNFWISLIFTKVSDFYTEPKGVYFLQEFRGLPAITVFQGIAQGLAGATYHSADISDREYRTIVKFLTESEGLWFTPHLDNFRSTGLIDLMRISSDFHTHFGFTLPVYSASSFPEGFRQRSQSIQA